MIKFLNSRVYKNKKYHKDGGNIMKFKKSLILLSSLILIFVLTACESDENDQVAEETTTVTEENTTAEEEMATEESSALEDEALTVFNAETLAEFNGKDGKAAYVAYEGKVYDVSNIAAWKNGIHQGKFEAGKDFTDILNNEAPHKPTNLTDNAPIVGVYE